MTDSPKNYKKPDLYVDFMLLSPLLPLPSRFIAVTLARTRHLIIMNIPGDYEIDAAKFGCPRLPDSLVRKPTLTEVMTEARAFKGGEQTALPWR